MPGRSGSIDQHDGRFVDDLALGYSKSLFESEKMSSARQLRARLQRFSRSYSLIADVPELDTLTRTVINTGIGQPTPFTERVSVLFNHPCFRRLRSELQLGLIKHVYPGATHTRWAHSIGVFSAAVQYYNSLLADPEVPTARLLLEPQDIEQGLVAAILHDLGQTSFAHDIEAACPGLFNHETIVAELLDEKFGESNSLSELIAEFWPRVSIQRVLAILKHSKKSSGNSKALVRSVDGLAFDMIDSPIDADKFDYLVRDSHACGVPYGLGIDRTRFLQALTLNEKTTSGGRRLAIAYRAKGKPAVESLLLARYQSFGALYWHHTFRCIQAMFAHAAAATFRDAGKGNYLAAGQTIDLKTIQTAFYRNVICRIRWNDVQSDLIRLAQIQRLRATVPDEIALESTLEFFWRFADNDHRPLLLALARRKGLYRRIFEMRTGEMKNPDQRYIELVRTLSPKNRLDLAKQIQRLLLESCDKESSSHSADESISQSEAQKQLHRLLNATIPLVVVDYPVRGLPDESNFPDEIGDAEQKYLSGNPRRESSSSSEEKRYSIFDKVRLMQLEMATLRVYASPELHEVVTRYLGPEEVYDCIKSVFPEVDNK